MYGRYSVCSHCTYFKHLGLSDAACARHASQVNQSCCMDKPLALTSWWVGWWVAWWVGGGWIAWWVAWGVRWWVGGWVDSRCACDLDVSAVVEDLHTGHQELVTCISTGCMLALVAEARISWQARDQAVQVSASLLHPHLSIRSCRIHDCHQVLPYLDKIPRSVVADLSTTPLVDAALQARINHAHRMNTNACQLTLYQGIRTLATYARHSA